MSTIDQILQIQECDPARLPNDLHLGLHSVELEQIKAKYDAEHPAPGKLAECVTDYDAAHTQEDQAYIIARGSDLTQQIAEQDAIRDDRQTQLETMMNAMLKMAAIPAMQQAAKALKPTWDVYKPNTKSAYEVQTTALTQWYDDFAASAEQVAAAETLGLTQVIADMMQANREVHRLILERSQQQGQQAQNITLKDARAQTDRAYRNFRLAQNAYAIIDANEHRYDDLIIGLNQQQDYYRQLYQERQRNNKRVFVASDVVGNHYYNVTAGWTWLQLAQKNPKALSPDPQPSAPGVEPVVIPLRIVSTDKEAQKAGGLCVALDGVPVLPTDVVDCDKEYELVPYTAE